MERTISFVWIKRKWKEKGKESWIYRNKNLNFSFLPLSFPLNSNFNFFLFSKHRVSLFDEKW